MLISQFLHNFFSLSWNLLSIGYNLYDVIVIEWNWGCWRWVVVVKPLILKVSLILKIALILIGIIIETLILILIILIGLLVLPWTSIVFFVDCCPSLNNSKNYRIHPWLICVTWRFREWKIISKHIFRFNNYTHHRTARIPFFYLLNLLIKYKWLWIGWRPKIFVKGINSVLRISVDNSNIWGFMRKTIW